MTYIRPVTVCSGAREGAIGPVERARAVFRTRPEELQQIVRRTRQFPLAACISHATDAEPARSSSLLDVSIDVSKTQVRRLISAFCRGLNRPSSSACLASGARPDPPSAIPTTETSSVPPCCRRSVATRYFARMPRAAIACRRRPTLGCGRSLTARGSGLRAIEEDRHFFAGNGQVPPKR